MIFSSAVKPIHLSLDDNRVVTVHNPADPLIDLRWRERSNIHSASALQAR